MAGFTDSESGFRFNNRMDFLTESENGSIINPKPDSAKFRSGTMDKAVSAILCRVQLDKKNSC